MADPQEVPKEVTDALSVAIGAGKARLARVALSGLGTLAASKGFGWVNPSDPTTGMLINFGVTAVISGVGKYLRDKGILPGWFPL